MWKDDLEGLMMLHDGVFDPTQEALMRARIVDEPDSLVNGMNSRQLQGLLKHELKAELSRQLF